MSDLARARSGMSAGTSSIQGLYVCLVFHIIWPIAADEVMSWTGDGGRLELRRASRFCCRDLQMGRAFAPN